MPPKFHAIAAAALLIATATNAVSGERDDCSRIESAADRLACYDATTTPPDTTRPEKDADNPTWTVKKSVSPLTDAPSVILATTSKEKADCQSGAPAPFVFGIRCRENRTSVIFMTSCFMTAGNIAYRVDDSKPRFTYMNDSNNGHALGLWSGKQSIPFIKQLFGATSLVVRMTPYRDNSFTGTFNIRGLEAEIAPLRKACHW